MPKVSVILPVYNAANYLREAVDSILAQTFTDFELLLLNDGSTDASESIILSYKDERIVYLRNDKNYGLVYTLNKGIDLARGEYIARMDADDVCLPERLWVQSSWLNEHPATAIVASFNILIDESGNETGYSEKDRRIITAAQIRKRMPVENCLTHPSVMGRARIFKAYPYSVGQRNIEDYDLWLRLLSDGYVIEKIAQPLLYYRVHQTSVTQSKLRKTNFFRKHFQCKKQYLAARIKRGKLNPFDLRVAKEALLDLGRAAAKDVKKFFAGKMKYHLLLFKRWVEDIVMFPFILLGKFLAGRNPLKKEYEIFFFFPFYHIGGAEKVHLNIAKATGNGNCIIFFTRKSQNDLFYREFAASGCEMRDISKYTDNKWIYFVNIIFRGMIAAYINNQKKKPLVFNGQCNFGYKLSPWIDKSIPQIELIHSLCSFSYIRIPFLPFISRTVMISTIRIQEHLDLYRRYGIPNSFDKKITFIMNGIDLPLHKPEPSNHKKEFTVLYVGRGTPEKRVHLIGEIASLVHQSAPTVRFVFLGDVQNAVPKIFHSDCIFLGNQSDAAVIDKVYREAAVLILVSETEGFPMVIMEAMARGLAIVSTSVGEVPLHIKEGANGFLLPDFLNEKSVVADAKQCVLQLWQRQELLHSISANNIDYAYAHFGMDRFANEYRKLIADVKEEYGTQ